MFRFTTYHNVILNIIGLTTIAWSLFFLSWSGWMIALLFYFLFQTVGVSVTLHRYYSHKAFEFKHEWMRRVSSIVSVLTGQSNPAVWAAIHVHHHKSTDTIEDPHGPIHGLWRSFVVPKWEPWDKKTIIRLTRDPFLKMLYDYNSLIVILYWLALFIVGGPWLLISAGVMPMGLTILATNAVNYFCHLVGYRNFNTKSEDHNNWIMAVLSFGEGWHNNHHYKPTSYTFQHKWWEIDPGAMVIRLIRR